MANITPPVATAAKTPSQPEGKKPPWAKKFVRLKETVSKAIGLLTGTITFQSVIHLFDSPNQLTPMRLIPEIRSKSPAATAVPSGEKAA